MLNNVSLKQLRAFVVVAEQGSFVGAAKTLGMSQPALSQCIRQFEQQVGSALFQRTTRRVRLTNLGRGFLPQARHLVREFDATLGTLSDIVEHKRGKVVISCLPSIAYRVMPRVIAAGEALHPGIRVMIRDGSMKDVVGLVKSGEADFGIGGFVVQEPELESTILGRDAFYAVFPRAHPLARKKTVRWSDLAAYPFVAMTHETGVRGIIDATIGPLDIAFKIVAEVTTLATVNGMLEEGIGISALPGLVLPRRDNARVTYRRLVEPVVERAMRVIWRQGAHLSPAAGAIIDAMKRTLSVGRSARHWPHVRWNASFEVPAAR